MSTIPCSYVPARSVCTEWNVLKQVREGGRGIDVVLVRPCIRPRARRGQHPPQKPIRQSTSPSLLSRDWLDRVEFVRVDRSGHRVGRVVTSVSLPRSSSPCPPPSLPISVSILLSLSPTELERSCHLPSPFLLFSLSTVGSSSRTCRAVGGASSPSRIRPSPWTDGGAQDYGQQATRWITLGGGVQQVHPANDTRWATQRREPSLSLSVTAFALDRLSCACADAAASRWPSRTGL